MLVDDTVLNGERGDRIFPAAVGPDTELNVDRDDGARRKGRGAFFTPAQITGFIVDWAVRHQADRVLEPSCGEAAFLLPAAEKLAELGATGTDQLRGVEVHQASAEAARRAVQDAGFPVSVVASDFFEVERTATFDAVVGNPPYIRYQDFADQRRARALRAAFSQGVRLTKLASSWAAFVVHAAGFLKPGGRLGLVLPAELLTVNYAAPVRRFLLDRFASVRLIMFEERVFPGVLEEVVLLLAEGAGTSRSFEVYQARDTTDLASLSNSDGWSGFVPDGAGKWTAALLPADSLAGYRSVVDSESFATLLDWGETYLGAVTGNNRYFTLTAEEAGNARLRPEDLLKISPPGSRHLRALTFGARSWEEEVRSGASCYLFYPRSDRPAGAAARYIQQGESEGVPAAYKCRVRSPWWRVPLVPIPDLLLTYMDQERPRLIANAGRVAHLNSLYGVRLRPGLRRLGSDLLPIAVLNSATLLGAEVVGRAYGGGLLKLEPKEADVLPVPSPEHLQRVAGELRGLRSSLATCLRRARLIEAVEMVDGVLFKGVPGDVLRAIRTARASLVARRTTRGRAGRGPG